MAKLKAGEYGVRVFGSRISRATELAHSLASNTNASEAITATATAAKALTAGIAQLNSILKKIQGDLAQVDSNLMTANRSLGEANARLRTNQATLAAVPKDAINLVGFHDPETIDKNNKNNKANSEKRTNLNKKISNDQANIETYTTRITQLTSQKWSLSVLANRILQSINKINLTHETLIPVRDKLVSFNESAGLGYLKFSVLALESKSAFETLWGNLNTMDNESRFDIYNTSLANLMNDKTRDGKTMSDIAPQLIAAQAKIVADEKAATNTKPLAKDEYSFGDYSFSEGSLAINDLGKTIDGLDQLTNGTLQSSNPLEGVGTLLKGAGNTGWHIGGAALHTVATVPALAGDVIHGINDVGEWIFSD